MLKHIHSRSIEPGSHPGRPLHAKNAGRRYRAQSWTSILRQVEYLVLTLLLTGCGDSSTSTPSLPKPPSDAPSTAAPSATPGDTTGLVRIARFDCVKADDLEPGADFPWSQGIASWSRGGPGGAVWNAARLRCAVEIQTDCSSGEVDVELRIGSALAGTQHAAIHRAGAHQLAFEVTAEQWELHFDQSSPLTERFSYRTATFSAAATAACKTPESSGPSEGPRLGFADDRHFTAGFAGGE
jgi:hypothetical protein